SDSISSGSRLAAPSSLKTFSVNGALDSTTDGSSASSVSMMMRIRIAGLLVVIGNAPSLRTSVPPRQWARRAPRRTDAGRRTARGAANADRRTGPPSTREATGHGRQPQATDPPAGADAGLRI